MKLVLFIPLSQNIRRCSCECDIKGQMSINDSTFLSFQCFFLPHVELQQTSPVFTVQESEIYEITLGYYVQPTLLDYSSIDSIRGSEAIKEKRKNNLFNIAIRFDGVILHYIKFADIFIVKSRSERYVVKLKWHVIKV